MIAGGFGKHREIDDVQRQSVGDAVAGDQAERITAGFCVRRHLDAQLDQVDAAFPAVGGFAGRLRLNTFDRDLKGRAANARRLGARETGASHSSGKGGAPLAGEGIDRNRARLLARLRTGANRKHDSDSNPESTHWIEFSAKTRSLPWGNYRGCRYSRGLGGITATHGKVPFFLMGRRNTLSPAVT